MKHYVYFKYQSAVFFFISFPHFSPLSFPFSSLNDSWLAEFSRILLPPSICILLWVCCLSDLHFAFFNFFHWLLFLKRRATEKTHRSGRKEKKEIERDRCMKKERRGSIFHAVKATFSIYLRKLSHCIHEDSFLLQALSAACIPTKSA